MKEAEAETRQQAPRRTEIHTRQQKRKRHKQSTADPTCTQARSAFPPRPGHQRAQARKAKEFRIPLAKQHALTIHDQYAKVVAEDSGLDYLER